MKKILLLILFQSFILADIIYVPQDYTTIQGGVDAAVDGDIVLVSQGTYFENIHITRSITLASYALYDDLTEWTEFDDDVFCGRECAQSMNKTFRRDLTDQFDCDIFSGRECSAT